MAKTNIAETVRALIADTVEALGYRLWDVEFTKIGADRHLIITIDSDTGVDLNACETVHRAVDKILDENGPIEDAYHLDVSSPGIERELRTDAHILASLGERCEAKLFAPLDGQKTLRGVLLSYEGGVLAIDTGAGVVRCPRQAVSKLRTVYFD